MYTCLWIYVCISDRLWHNNFDLLGCFNLPTKYSSSFEGNHWVFKDLFETFLFFFLKKKKYHYHSNKCMSWVLEHGDDFFTQCILIKHHFAPGPFWGTDIKAVLRTTSLQSWNLHSSKKTDSGQVNRLMCLVVRSSMKENVRGERVMERGGAISAGWS